MEKENYKNKQKEKEKRKETLIMIDKWIEEIQKQNLKNE